jgi:hypothetical protein
VLHPGNRPENAQLEDDEQWKLLTVRSWGELARGDWSIAITDISEGDVSVCADYPWISEFQYQDTPFYIDCETAESSKRNYCLNGEPQDDVPEAFLEAKYDGRTAEEACCACGGGLSTTQFTDRLVQWRIVVYGRSFNRVPTISPMPTQSPTLDNGPTRSSAQPVFHSLGSCFLVGLVSATILWLV